MFTGIVTEVGRIRSAREGAGGVRLRIDAPGTSRGLAVGGSVAVDGVCLTAVEVGRGGFSVDVVPETMRRSNLKDAAAGRRVNLERPLAAGDEMGGHFVQGHVDATSRVSALRRRGEEVVMEIRTPKEIAGLVVDKGSIAVNGVSLTIAAARRGSFQVALIPHTLEKTNLSEQVAGSDVNLEADILGKYVRSCLERRS